MPDGCGSAVIIKRTIQDAKESGYEIKWRDQKFKIPIIMF